MYKQRLVSDAEYKAQCNSKHFCNFPYLTVCTREVRVLMNCNYLKPHRAPCQKEQVLLSVPCLNNLIRGFTHR